MIRTRKIFIVFPILAGIISLIPALITCERFDPAGELYFYADSISAGSTRGTYTFSGAVVNVGKHGISQHGFCWSQSEHPYLDRDTSTRLGALESPREFSSTVTGLLVNTRYHVRAYATTDAGTEYSEELSFTTPPADLPVVTTLPVSNIGPDSATSGGNITNDGGSPVSARGVCWSTSADPTTSNGHTEDGNGTGSYSSSITGLEPNTKYFVRAYATNGQGTAYGNEINFTTLRAGETIIDYDGNIYGTVRIGDQTWMAENLRVTHYADGSAIPYVESTSEWDDLDYDDRAYCWYQNDSTLAEPYGALYTWAAAMNLKESSEANPSEVQGVCPQGWHLPSDPEWKELEIFLGMSQEEADKEQFRGTDEGGKLKESGTLHWSAPNTGATNEYGFTALPAGLRSGTAVFNWIGVEAYFWSATEDFGVDAWIRRLAHNDARISRYGNSRYSGLSVRCVKDEGSISKPAVITTAASSVTDSSALSGGEVTSDGGAAVTARGVCWNTTRTPDLTDSCTFDGAGTGSFTSSITGLDCNTTYYIRAYATNSVGTAYGDQEEFTTDECTSVSLPSVTTAYLSSITTSSATGGGNVTDDGGGTITARGVCWSTSQGPMITDDITTDETGIGSFISEISGLTKSTTYYVRAYATNSAGTDYGEEVILRTYEGTVTDYDGNQYWTVLIGEQVWMAENLRAVHDADGNALNLVEDGADWTALDHTDRAYCWYDNNASYADEYGALYTWAAAMNGSESNDNNPSGLQGICPDGWHLPGDAEWQDLEIHLGMDQSTAEESSWRGTDEGNKLREAGISHWDSPNAGATNESGFTALPGGIRFNSGVFGNFGASGSYWTVLAGSALDAWHRSLSFDNNTVYRGKVSQEVGISVRCMEGTGVSLPVVTTGTVDNLTGTSGEGGGNVTDDGGGTVTERGVCWSENPDPTTDDETVVSGAGMGTFTGNIDGLTRGTKYYVRAYATNEAGTGYGAEVSFTTLDYPTVTTTAIVALTETSAEISGEVTSDGGDPVTARGICWSTGPEPTISDNTVPEGAGVSTFTGEITGLSIFTRYYVRAYATNEVGTAYGEELTFRTKWNNATVTDYDGNVYNTVAIGDQIWLARNLSTTRYSDGTAIQLVESTSGWEALNFDDKAYCWYENNIGNINTYGALYTWAAAARGDSSKLNPSGLQGACPDGYHLPSDEEWKDLEMALGMTLEEADMTGPRGTDEGGQLKETGNDHWGGENIGATNESGFTGLGNGERDFNGNFLFLGYIAPIWSSSQYSDSQAWIRALHYDNEKITRNPYTKSNGYAIRCVRD